MSEDEMEEAVSAVFRCRAEAARKLLTVFSWKSLRAKDVLANQGTLSHQCWIVIEGAIRVEAIGVNGQLQQLAQYGPGEFFGSYPDASQHRAEITAASRSRLLVAESVRLAAEIESDVQLAAGMARLLARQLDRSLDRMVMRSTYSAAGRVYAELLALAGPEFVIAPPPRVTSLALAANTTRETASRAIGALARRGIISREEDRLVIHSPRMIEELIC
ncbi:Crp/Fnr family transcriptional regulator [Novosphingobium sp. MBES04]|uniref:Crp/Fnr family transcriptional regulator n=1 Tax=Novosphingobium sp. MBES04 TaxID=1206458 RepID=UPI000A4B5D52|nr:Crp/Fnr family transcriptional regulator [Novosphingobium sp. MBES04]